MGTANYGSIIRSSRVNSAPISSGSSSATLCSILVDSSGQSNFLDKKITEETPLKTRTPDCYDEGAIIKTKFLLGVNEKQFWLMFTGIMIVNFVGSSPSSKCSLPDLTIWG